MHHVYLTESAFYVSRGWYWTKYQNVTLKFSHSWPQRTRMPIAHWKLVTLKNWKSLGDTKLEEVRFEPNIDNV